MKARSPFAMMEPPPADRDLDLQSVRTVVGAQFPDCAAAEVSRLGSGWEHDAYLVDGSVVFRFPRYADVAEGLDYDIAVHELVERCVGDTVRVPRVSRLGSPSAAFPHRFVGHDLIRGVGAEDPRAPVSEELGLDLGRALTRVHSIDAGSARAVGVPVMADDCAAALSTLLAQVQLVPIDAIAGKPAAWLASGPAVPPPYPGNLRFIHSGLHGEHIIVEAETGRLSGLIDWSSAALGDPTVDLAFLVALRGQGLLDAALANYSLDLDTGAPERTLFRARVRVLGWLVNAVRTGEQTDRIMEQVRYVFTF